MGVVFHRSATTLIGGHFSEVGRWRGITHERHWRGWPMSEALQEWRAHLEEGPLDTIIFLDKAQVGGVSE
jgi:hypothetical protein